MDVGQALLHDPEQRRLDHLGQPAGALRLGQGEIDADAAAVGEPLRVPAHGRPQVPLLEGGRVQEVRQGPHLAAALLRQLDAVAQLLARHGAQATRRLADHAEVHAEGRQALRRAVVQLAGDAAALDVLRLQEQP